MASAVAALMSTADSAMMAFSSIVTVDLVQPALARGGRDVPEATLLKLGKVCSLLVVAVNVGLTVYPMNLDTLLKLQNELAMQARSLLARSTLAFYQTTPVMIIVLYAPRPQNEFARQ
jgi:Na+/proline symporter